MRSNPFAGGRRAIVKLVGLLVVLPLGLGCGARQGTVSGRVLLNGEPLPGGRLTFRPADPKQNSVSADLDEHGAYEAVLPVGDVKVCIDNRHLAPRAAGSGQLPPGLPFSPDVRKTLNSGKPDSPPPGSEQSAAEKPRETYVPIPDRYRKMETSKLQFTVAGGDQKQDLELTK
jgi:hypothetical protein